MAASYGSKRFNETTQDAGPLPAFLTREKGKSLNVKRPWHLPNAAPLLRAALVAAFAVALCILLDWQFGLVGPAAQLTLPVVQKSSEQEPTPVVEPRRLPILQLPSELPLPSRYGVFAVSGSQLHELEVLVGEVPDQRIFMSMPIRTPSHTVLPNGRIVFIIYRHDAANGAPESASVRVVAKIINKGAKVNTANVEDSWTIRNVSYDFRVARLHQGSEMLLVEPENADLVFPAGRYGLVIEGEAYDFTIAGSVTEAPHCLERTQAAFGAFYSECPNPR
jgi:hypothetical protein